MATATPIVAADSVPFIVTEEADGTFSAYARYGSHSLVTQGDDPDDLRAMVRDCVACAFDEDERPAFIHLHFVRDETLAA